MADRTQEERLERLKSIIELLYGPKGSAEAARRMKIAPTQLAVTLRGERNVTANLEMKVAKLVIEDAPRIAANAAAARGLAVDIGVEMFGPETMRALGVSRDDQPQPPALTANTRTRT